MDQLSSYIKQKKIIAIVRGISKQHLEPMAYALVRGGIRLIEVTFNQSSSSGMQDTVWAISALKTMTPDLHVGAGTVLTEEQVKAAHQAGAEYIISPDTNERIIKYTRDLGMLSIPGAMTPTEIMKAYRDGANFVKVFPAGDLGANYIKSIRSPISHIPLLAVGGVDKSNMRILYQAGVLGFGVGSCLVSKNLIEAGRYEELESLACEFVSIVEGLD